MGSGTRGRGHRVAAGLLAGIAAVAMAACASHQTPSPAPREAPSAETPAPQTSTVPEARVLEAEAEALVAAGDLFGAIDRLERAVELRESVPGHDRLEVAETLERLADLLEAVGRPQRSSAVTERALEIRTSGREAPDGPRALAGLAWVEQRAGRAEEALDLQRRALARLDTGQSEHAPVERALRARLHARRGLLLREQGRDEEAIVDLDRARLLLDPTRPEENLLLARVGVAIAAIAAASDQRDVAVLQLARALAIFDALLPADAPEIGETVARLALASLLRGDVNNAIVLFDRAIAIAERTDEPDLVAIAMLRDHRTRGELLRASSQLAHDAVEPACARYAEVVARLEALPAADPESLALGRSGLGECALRRDQPEEALSHYRGALAALDGAPTPEPTLEGSLRANLAALHASSGRHEDAVTEFERALAAWDAAPDADPVSVANVLYHAGNSYLALGRRPEALVRFVRALSLREESLPGDHPDLARSLDSVGAMLLERRDFEGARPLLERAVAIHLKRTSRSVELGASLSYLGRVQARQGEREAARETLARAVELLEPALGKVDPLTLATRAALENARAPLPASRRD